MVSIVILAQNEKLFKQCLSRIRLCTEGDYEIIVVNDTGLAGAVKKLQSTPDCKVITNETLSGVAKGYNQGAKVASGDLLVFMRDHMCVSEGWLERLTACMQLHEHSAMVGPVINDVSGVQRVSVTCTTMKQFDNASQAVAVSRAGRSQRVSRLISNLLMMRREAFERLEGFDERFGLESYEDDDICYRALRAGYELYVAQDCFARYTQPPSLFPDVPGWYNELLERNRLAAYGKWGFDLNAALQNWKWGVTVSLCMIVKNEEATLDRCLSSVAGLVDEIVIVDTGSTDRTKEIAGKYTDKIVDFLWVDDFSKARNFAFSQATKEYVLWLDADDVLLPEDAHKFKLLVSALEWNADSVSMIYNLAFDESGQVSSSLRRNRLVKRDNNFQWIGVVHEYLSVSGKIVYSDICVTHDRKHEHTSRNLNIYEGRARAGEPFSLRDTLYYAHELADNKLWERAVDEYAKFLESPDGWVEDKIIAYGRSADCLLELGKFDEARKIALQSFACALPRAELCCKLGLSYMKEERFGEAAFWYDLALKTPKPLNNSAVMHHACWTWLPHLQLCVCYDRLGNRQAANGHNEAASVFVPTHVSVIGNRQYFERMNNSSINAN